VSSSRAGLVAALYLKQQVRTYGLLGFRRRFLCALRSLGLRPLLVIWSDHMMLIVETLTCHVLSEAGGGGRASRLFVLSRRP
jgi:hypothetical protein